MPKEASFSISAAQRDLQDKEVFMTLLDRDASKGLYYTPIPCACDVVTMFLKTTEGRAIGKTRLRHAMERLKKKNAWIVKPHPMRTGDRATGVVVRDRRYGTYDPDDGEPIAPEDEEQDDDPGSPVRWLEQELRGAPKVSDEIFAAAKVRGFTQSQMMAAKNTLKVVAFSEGTPSVWKWRLP